MVQSSTAERNDWAELIFNPSLWSLPEGTFPETVYGTPSSLASHLLHCTWDPTPESGCSSRSGGGVECPLLSPIRLQHPVPNSLPNKDSTVVYTAAPNSRYFCAPEVQPPGGQIPCLSYVFGLELFMKERKGRGRKGEGRRKKKERKGEGSEMGRRANKKIIINLHSLWSLWEWPALIPH